MRRYYVWKAIDTEGKSLKGKWEVENVELLKTDLKNKGYYLLWVKKGIDFRIRNEWKDAYEFWSHFTYELAIMLRAGIPVLKALEMLTQNEAKDKYRNRWKRVTELVRTGQGLSFSISTIFPPPPPFIQGMVKAGEYSGCLQENLHKCNEQMEREYELLRSTKEALAYPVFLFGMTVLTFLGLNVGVIPRYENLYASFNYELPFITQAILKMNQIVPYIVIITAFLTILSIIGFRVKYKESWKKQWEKGKRRLPLIGQFYRQRDMVQFCAIVGQLLRAGVPILESLNIALKSSNNPDFQLLIQRALLGLKEGQKMSTFLRSKPEYFPPLVCDLVAVGENTGQLDQMLTHIAHIKEKEMGVRLKRMTKRLEPMLILGTAVLIGVLAIGMLMPIFDLSTYL